MNSDIPKITHKELNANTNPCKENQRQPDSCKGARKGGKGARKGGKGAPAGKGGKGAPKGGKGAPKGAPKGVPKGVPKGAPKGAPKGGKGKTPCWFFPQGKCLLGDNCSYGH